MSEPIELNALRAFDSLTRGGWRRFERGGVQVEVATRARLLVHHVTVVCRAAEVDGPARGSTAATVSLAASAGTTAEDAT